MSLIAELKRRNVFRVGTANDLVADWGMISRAEASGRMVSLAEQALVLDDQLAEAWVHLSRARRANEDLKGARAAQERALELDPRNPLVLRGTMDHWWWSHEPERGLAYANELLRVDPLPPVNRFSPIPGPTR